MRDSLDQLVARLAAAPADHALEHLEPEVTRAIAILRVRARANSALAPIRVGSIGLAMAVGVAAGGLTAGFSAAPQASGAFSPTALAPSTLLDGAQ